MVGALSLQSNIGLVRMHGPNHALTCRTQSTVDLSGAMRGFGVTDLNYTNRMVVRAASARLNDPLWSTWEGCKEGERNRAEPIVLASALHLSTSPCCFCKASAPSKSMGLSKFEHLRETLARCSRCRRCRREGGTAGREVRLNGAFDRRTPGGCSAHAGSRNPADATPATIRLPARSSCEWAGSLVCVSLPFGAPVQRAGTSRGSIGAM